MAKLKKQKSIKTPEKNKTSFKKWLKNNKIYFDTITIPLTIVAIVISVIALSASQRSIKLQEEQALAEVQSNMPVFNISQERHDDAYVINGRIYPPGIETNIVNNGGNLSGGLLRADTNIEISIWDKEYNSIGTVIIDSTLGISGEFSYYDAQTKSFTISESFEARYGTREYELLNFLREQLASEYKDYNFAVWRYDYLNIDYKDFRDQPHFEYYMFSGSSLIKASPSESKYRNAIDVDTMTNEEVYLEVKELINALLSDNT